MSVLRPGTETETPSEQATGPHAAPSPWYVRRRRLLEAAGFVVLVAALFTVYLRLSRTMPENSDQANVLLQAWDMLHGNLLLHGWDKADVSFYTTELPQYALLVLIFGVHANTAHIAAAMTYTLAVLLAIRVARGGFTSRAAVVRMLIAAGIVLAPQLGIGISGLLLSVGHIGTSVPVLLILLFLDGAPQRLPGRSTVPAPGGAPPPRTPLADPPARAWYVPVLTGLGLAWVLVADQIVLIVGVIPLALVCALRVIEGAVRERSVSRAVRARWYELSLIAAAGVAVGLAWVAERVLRALGGYVLSPIPYKFTRHEIAANLHSLWAVPEIFGADYRGLAGGPYYVALLHMVSLALVGLALLLVAWRFFAGAALVDQVLAVAIVGNILLFVVTSAGAEGPHEIAVVAPFGAALAARMLAGSQASQTQAPRTQAPRTQAPRTQAPRTQAPRTQAPRTQAQGALARRTRAVAYGAGLVVLLGYVAGLAHEVVQPAAPPDNSRLASWLEGHHLRYGLAGYWESSIVTVETGGQVKVRALLKNNLQPDLWLAKPAWYDSAGQQATFIVLNSTPGYLYWEPRALIKKYFGRPARTYNVGPYTVMVWDRNLLPSVPR